MRDNYSSKIPKSLIPYTLPSNWTWFFWSDIMKSYQQGMIRSNRELGEGNVYYLKMGDLNDNGVVNLTDLSIANATEKEIKEFQLTEGDFLINVRNSRELVGKTCVIRQIDKTILYNHMLVRINNGSPEMNYFINAFLNIPSSKKLLDRIKQGTTTVIALYQRELNQLPIPLPDTLTFNTIISLYKSIDAKIELNNRINRELEAIAKTLYDYWFVQFDFPNEQGKPYKSSGGKMVYNAELKREIPEGWEVKSIFQCSNVQYGFPFSTAYFNTDGKGVPVIRIRDILENSISNFSTENNIDNKYLIRKGDLLVGMDGNFHLNYWSKDGCYLNQRAVKLSETILPNIYLRYQIEPFIKLREKSVSRTTVGHLSDKDLKSLNVLIPSKEVLTSINSIYKSVLERIIQTQNENQQLSELRDWLLPMLMNGQVTVRQAHGIAVKEAEEKLSMAAEPSVEYKIQNK